MSHPAQAPLSPDSDGVLEPPGRDYHSLSPRPFHDAARFVGALKTFVQQRRAAHAPHTVFRAHVGVRAVLLTCAESARFFLTAPEDVLGREGKDRFGPVRFRRETLRHAYPAVLSAGPRHTHARAFTTAVMAHRRAAFEPALQATTAATLRRWAAMHSFELFPEITQWSSDLVYGWLFDLDGPTSDELATWIAGTATLAVEGPVARRAAELVLPRCPMSAIRLAEQMEHHVTTSPHFPAYARLAAEHDIPAHEVASLLCTTAMINGVGAAARILPGTILAISQAPDVWATLHRELQGLPLTPEAVQTAPYLRATMLETGRLFQRPRYIFKEAQRDFVLPAKAGRMYRIRRGDLLGAVFPIISRDPDVYDDPDRFRPERFLESPALAERVWNYGVAPGRQNTYGCAALSTGEGPRMMSWLMAALFRDHSWRLSTPVEFDVDHFAGLAPDDVRLVGFQGANS